MPKSTITFVTALLDLSEDRSKDKSVQTCVNHFRTFAAYGFTIALYVSESLQEIGESLTSHFPNVRLMGIINLEDTWTDQTIRQVSLSLPERRTEHHDTRNFMTLMNAKIEFVAKAIDANPFNTTHYAWIDFSINHVIRSPHETYKRLNAYAHSDLSSNMLTFPACWTKERSELCIQSIAKQIHWRFCGGFFLGDKNSVLDFFQQYKQLFPTFLNQHKTLVWEVNVWAWMESISTWAPESWIAGHDDSILRIPSKYLEVDASLTTIPPRLESCRLAIDSLLPQVRLIYLNIATRYKRFGDFEIPSYLCEEPYKSKVIVCKGEDYGPATKYIGGLHSIPESAWIFFCDDDQEYHSSLIMRMKERITDFAVYQNRYEIVRHGSGGIIHGYVGNIGHRSQFQNLLKFPLPECAYFVDDQWMSIYCWSHNIPILPTGIEKYNDIYKVLQNGYEKIGAESLAALGNREHKVKELASYFGVVFEKGGSLRDAKNSSTVYIP